MKYVRKKPFLVVHKWENMVYTRAVKHIKRRPIMKRKSILVITLVLSLCLAMLLTSCEENPCAHDFESSCDPECGMCGFERVTGHVWKESTCTQPKACRNCDLTEGEALGHTHDHDCENDTVCANCFMVAYATEHRPDENGVCTICGESLVVTTEVE
jgi:hypothetical protein